MMNNITPSELTVVPQGSHMVRQEQSLEEGIANLVQHQSEQEAETEFTEPVEGCSEYIPLETEKSI